MTRSTVSKEQVVEALRQVEDGRCGGSLCRQQGSDAIFYAWRKRYAHLGVRSLDTLGS